jgi:P27 family predicted phage terminase small subunit
MRKVSQAEWRLVVPDLDRMGLLAHLDRGLLVQHCVREAVMDACRRSVAEDGIEIEQTVTKKDGSTYTQSVRNPALLTMAECERAINSFRAELGLGPSSRGRLNVPKRDEVEDAERKVFNG